MAVAYQLILGNYIHPINDKSCEFQKEGALLLTRGENGRDWLIHKRGSEREVREYLASCGVRKSQVKERNYRGNLLLPGLLDLHFHWVQDDVRLMPKNSLLNWLETYTWPYEEKFSSRNFSRRRAKRFARELLQVGTLGGACYASVHPHTVSDALEFFKGDFCVGNVLMTMNSPDYLQREVKQTWEETKNLAGEYREQFVFTPRFAPSTSPGLMKKCAELAHKYGCFIQSHLSETPEECQYAVEIFKKIKGFEKIQNYTDIYDACGLLGERTVMGHGIYLGKSEWKRLAETKTAIAHCPSSNAPVRERGLGSGLFDFRRAEKEGVRWGLGSDIGAGPYLSMFDVMRSFVTQNRKKSISEATYIKALNRATRENARILQMESRVGDFGEGKEANILVVESPRKRPSREPERLLKSLVERPLKKRGEYHKIIKEAFLRGVSQYRR